MTHAFVASVLDAVGARLEEVRIEALREETFYAIVELRIGDTVQEIDARPSDALALAVLADSPIYAADEVMAKGGFDLTGEVEDLEAGESKWRPMTEDEKEEVRANWDKHGDLKQRKVITYLYGIEDEEQE